MSFSTHPFRDLDIGYDGDGCYRWVCDSCGATSRIFSGATNLIDIHIDYINHIERSHKLDRYKVEGWTSRI